MDAPVVPSEHKNTPTIPPQLTVMFYNLENFYAPQGREITSFSQALPTDWKWNERRYGEKLERLNHMLDFFEAEKQVLPDILGCAEIGGRKVIRDIADRAVFQQKYQFIHFESLDERAVDTAMLYNTETVELLHAEPYAFFFQMEAADGTYYDTTRDVLYCHMRHKATRSSFHTFVVHLPSKREQDVNLPKRQLIVQRLQEKISDLRQTDASPILLMGDFNDNSTAELFGNYYGVPEYQSFQPAFKELYLQRKFSTFHLSQGLLFDQILVSEPSETYPKFLITAADVYAPPFLRSWQRKNKGRPYRTFSGRKYNGGLSDHFPVYAVLEILTYP